MVLFQETEPGEKEIPQSSVRDNIDIVDDDGGGKGYDLVSKPL